MTRSFDFGENWKSYSEKSLDAQKFSEAKASLKELFQRDDLNGLRFLDVGCGSGIFSVAAKQLGARQVVGIDISANSVEASENNARKFGFSGGEISFFKADILSKAETDRLGLFDAVYAWGCLHHTGNLWQAVENTLPFVRPGGCLVLALYNRHVSSGFWNAVKVLYAHSPQFFKKILVWLFFGPIYAAKWVLTRKDPMSMKRGMDFYHDIVDWVGGYPYEYASAEEVTDFLRSRGFELKKLWRTDLLVGNNQFLLERKDS